MKKLLIFILCFSSLAFGTLLSDSLLAEGNNFEGDVNISGDLKLNGRLFVEKKQDEQLRFKTLDDSWLYTTWYDSGNARRTWMGLDKDLDTFRLSVEGATNKIVLSGGNVGIGILDPSESLEVHGRISATGGFKLPDGTIIDDAGDLGSGGGGGGSGNISKLTNPDGSITAVSVDVLGNLKFSSRLLVEKKQDEQLKFKTLDDSWLYMSWYDSGNGRRTWMGLDKDLDTFSINVEGATDKIVLNGGNVGIGLADPSESLEVNGRISATGGFKLPDGTIIDDAGDLGSGGGGGGSENVWKLTSPDGSITALSVNASGHLILSEVPGDVGLGPFTSN